MKLSRQVLPLIPVSILEMFHAVAAFQSLFEGAFINLGFAEDEFAKPIFFTIFPFSIV
jgi:hypothetical protein